MMATARRKFEPKCHVCDFIQKEPEYGEMIEQWLILERRDLWDIANHLNEHPYYSEQLKKPLTYKKLYTHKLKHLPDKNLLFREAKQKAMDGSGGLEQVINENLAAIETLKTRGLLKISSGQIDVHSLNDFFMVVDRENELLGDQLQNIKGQGGTGMQMPPEILMEIFKVMGEFVPVTQRRAFREYLDEHVKPKVKAAIMRQEQEALMAGKPEDEDVEDVEAIEES